MGDDARLAGSPRHGEFAINGFRNRDVRVLLFGQTGDAPEIRRQSGKVGRLLRLFRDHGLTYRVKWTRRYQLSAMARRTLPALLAARSAGTAKLQELAVCNPLGSERITPFAVQRRGQPYCANRLLRIAHEETPR